MASSREAPAVMAQTDGAAVILERGDLGRLISALADRGYQVVGPTVREGAIVYDTVSSPSDLPIGWTDQQEAGTYRLKRRADEAVFGYAVGPHSWKKLLHPPSLLLWRANRTEGQDSFAIQEQPADVPRYAFLGVRACELRAIAIQDRVYLEGPHVDPDYQRRREGVFIVALNCSVAGGTCFCVSMKTGPRATQGFDLALTEILEEDRHHFVLEVGSERGGEVLRDVPHRPAGHDDRTAVDQVVEETARHMGRKMETEGIKQLLYGNLDHPRWDQVAARCLTCANCTMVCPTCFCTTVEDTTDLTGEHAERWRKWDSCFTMDFSYVHGGNIRPTARSRYRQWMTHKLGTWIDQFGTSGCVGCGRCITWCPVGIDITEEVAAIRASDSGGPVPEEQNRRADS